MRETILRDGCDRITPGLAAVAGGVHGDGDEGIEVRIVIVEDLAVVEVVGVGAIYTGVATQEVEVVGTRIDGAIVGEGFTAVGGVGGTAEALTAGAGVEERRCEHATRIVVTHHNRTAATRGRSFTLREAAEG